MCLTIAVVLCTLRVTGSLGSCQLLTSWATFISSIIFFTTPIYRTWVASWAWELLRPSPYVGRLKAVPASGCGLALLQDGINTSYMI